MTGLQRTGLLLTFALVPWIGSGCANSKSRLVHSHRAVSEHPEELAALAQQYEAEGNYAEASKLYLKLYRQDRQSAFYAHRLGVCFTNLGKFEPAAAAFRKAEQLDPHNQDLLADIQQASELSSKIKPPKARPALVEQAVVSSPAEVAPNAIPTSSTDEAAVEVATIHETPETVDDQSPAATPFPSDEELAAVTQAESVTLTAEPVVTEVLQPVVDQDAETLPVEDLTGWTEAEEYSEAARQIPSEPAAETVQTVESDDAPFTIVEAPMAEHEELVSEPAPLADSPLELSDDEPQLVAAAPKADLDRFGAEAQDARVAQLKARSGQHGFMGFCPVKLRDEMRLVDAEFHIAAEHQSQTYEFSSEEAKQKFEANPARYLPAAGGLDVVAVSQGTAVAVGSLEHAAWFRHKLYLFINAENRDLFMRQARQFAVDF